MFLVQINDTLGILEELVHVGVDREIATSQFLGACETGCSNWDEYSPDDVEEVLDEGYLVLANGRVIQLIDTDGFTSDDAIAAAINKQPSKTVDKITKWLRTGEIGEAPTITELIERAGRLLDKSESHEICGQVIFEAEDGKTYVVTTEACVGEIDPDYLEELLEGC